MACMGALILKSTSVKIIPYGIMTAGTTVGPVIAGRILTTSRPKQICSHDRRTISYSVVATFGLEFSNTKDYGLLVPHKPWYTLSLL